MSLGLRNWPLVVVVSFLRIFVINVEPYLGNKAVFEDRTHLISSDQDLILFEYKRNLSLQNGFDQL